jgi:23S rRNA (cytidine1920-2'-O)/16S rRNA (cytidine1409-2'-O)-methyltransferase
MAGRVLTGTLRIDKPGTEIGADADLLVRAEQPYVSRGGRKLEHALDDFGVRVEGRHCLDAGCSTGGFTDCLLSRGAARVHAVDVGYGQLAWKLRQDERVVVRERTNIRTLEPSTLVPRPDLVVADLAFIALRTVLPQLAMLAAPRAEFVLLIKPQFELPRADLERGAGGVVTLPELHDKAVELVKVAAREAGLSCAGCVDSPVLGADGNREIFVLIRRDGVVS